MDKAWTLDLFTRSPQAPRAPLPVCLSTRRQVWTVGVVCALLCSLLYLATVAPSVGLGHDTGELTTCCIIQGVPHSPGYPLFVALGWLASQLPLDGEPAYKINLLCALEVGLAMGFLGAGLAVACRPWPALIATLLAGTCTAIWRQAVVTEVFALHLLFLAILTWLALLWEHAEDKRRREIVLVTSFILGCCLAHQHIIAVAAPAFLLYGAMAKGKGRPWGFSWLNLPVFLAALILPYWLQLYCAQQSPALNWESPTTWGRLKDHFLRKSYGTGVLNTAALQFDSRAGDAQVSAFWISVVRSYFPFPSFVFLALCCDRLIAHRFSARIVLYLGLALLYGPIFAILGNQPSQEFYADMMERFYSSSTLGMAGMIAFGIDWAAYSLWPQTSRFVPLLLLMVVSNGILNFPKSSQRGNYLALDLVRAQVAELPPRSVFLVNGDLPAGATDYLRYGLGERRDLIVILVGLASADWFRDRLPVAVSRAATQDVEGPLTHAQAVKNMVTYLQSRGYPIYSTEALDELPGEYTRIGLLWRYQGTSPTWSKAQFQAEFQRVFKLLEASPRRGPRRMDWKQNFWTRYCLNEWVQGYLALAKGLAEVDPASACLAMDKVIEIGVPPKLENYLNRAALRLHLKRYAEAIEDYEWCLKLVPNSRLALQGMVEAQQGVGDAEMVRRYSKRLLEVGP
jgi:tetratricopeptide (TPR) repeat protein